MSVKVDLDQLAEALTDFTFAYLITVGDDYRVHTVAVDAVLTNGLLDVGTVGRSTSRNAAAHPDVTIVWPPRETGGYTLIVDGRAEIADGGLAILPASAVLHRKAPPNAQTVSGCGDDCVPIGS
jgi:hypothetical protein